MPTIPPPPPPLPVHTAPLVGRHRRIQNRHRSVDTTPAHSADDAPATSVFSVADVRVWLAALGHEQYADVFMANEINGPILKTLTSEELRDDLQVTNLRHRRDLLDAISALIVADNAFEKVPLPEHGRILDHLSNVRTYHSWVRVGVQLLAFAVVTLRLAPNFRDTPIVAAAAFYFACVGIFALLYAIYRYRAVIRMIEQSGPSSQRYTPDRAGVLSIVTLVLIACILSLTIIALHAT